jgi:hypothetical protein
VYFPEGVFYLAKTVSGKDEQSSFEMSYLRKRLNFDRFIFHLNLAILMYVMVF